MNKFYIKLRLNYYIIKMKKLILGLSAVAILFSAVSCKKEKDDTNDKNTGGIAVEKKQRSFIGYVSATWCGPCGAYGGPTFKSTLNSKSDNEVIMLNIQTSTSKATPYFKRPSSMDNMDSVYISPIMGELFNSLNIPVSGTGSFSIPAFSANNAYIGSSSTTQAALESAITSNNAKSPLLGVGATKSINGNTISVDTKVDFYEQGSGEYFYSVVVLEDKHVGYQLVGSTANNSYEHYNFARAAMANGGEMHTQATFSKQSFASGSVASGQSFSKNFTFNYQSYTDAQVNPAFGLLKWNMTGANTKVAVMVWKKNGTKYEFVNGVIAK